MASRYKRKTMVITIVERVRKRVKKLRKRFLGVTKKLPNAPIKEKSKKSPKRKKSVV